MWWTFIDIFDKNIWCVFSLIRNIYVFFNSTRMSASQIEITVSYPNSNKIVK